jgi:hypothetical protein
MRQQAPWTSEDVTAVQTIGNILGPVRVLSHEETCMTTETAPADFTGEADNGWAEATGANQAPPATYPETPPNPHNHVYTWSPKLPDNSMLVIRANTPDELVMAVEAMAPLAARLKAAWQGVVGQPQAPVAPQGGVNYNPQTPPPNLPFPGQPAWQQAGAPQVPAQGQWAGGQQQGQRKEYPAPQGWMRLNGARKEQVDAVAAQFGVPKGNPSKGGAYNFFGLTPSGQPGKAWYCSPEAAQVFAQFNPMAA